jgi:hypothetical protein
MLLKNLDLHDISTATLITFGKAIQKELTSRKPALKVAVQLSRLQTPITFPSEKESYQAIVDANSVSLLEMPRRARNIHFRDRTRYLPCVLGQNWDHLFPYADTTERIYYVYSHVDPRGMSTQLPSLNTLLKGDPFYVGKGSASRAWDLKRNQGHGKRIKLIRDAGFPDISLVHIITDHLTELEALTLEAKLIYYFGSIYDELANGCLLNLADHIKPEFVGIMAKIPARKQRTSR